MLPSLYRAANLLLITLLGILATATPTFAQQQLFMQVIKVAQSQVIQQPENTTWDMRQILARSQWQFLPNGKVIFFASNRPGFSKPIATYEGRYQTQANTINFNGCNIDPDCRPIGDIAAGYYSRFAGTVDLSQSAPEMVIDWQDFRDGKLVESYRLRLILQVQL